MRGLHWLQRMPRRPPVGGSPAAIGIPRALFYYLHPALWETFFDQAGFPVVVSAPTDRRVLERAGLVSEPEHCLPVKLLDAHLDALIGRVERVFVPRILSTRAGHIACPKLSALPDAARAQFGDRLQVVTADVDEGKRSLDGTLDRLGRRLGVPAGTRRAAARGALAAMTAALREVPAKPPTGATEDSRPFLLLGHPYNLMDDFLAGPVIRKLERLAMPVERIGFERGFQARGPIRWDTCSVMLEKLKRLDAGRYAGVIVLSSFNCGCDSITQSLLRDAARERRLPLMTLILDEHTGQAGLDTRLEAFVDSIGGRR